MSSWTTKCLWDLSVRPCTGSARVITYTVNKTVDGWKIEAQLPKRVSKSDQIKVLDWFRLYRAEVRRANPTWMARFHVGNNGYVLEVKPAQGKSQGILHLSEQGGAKHVLDETLTTYA